MIVYHALKGYNVPLLPDAGALMLVVSRFMTRLCERHSGQQTTAYCRIKVGPGIGVWPMVIAGQMAASGRCASIRLCRAKCEQCQRKKG